LPHRGGVEQRPGLVDDDNRVEVCKWHVWQLAEAEAQRYHNEDRERLRRSTQTRDVRAIQRLNACKKRSNFLK
jgi:hypothetical protein